MDPQISPSKDGQPSAAKQAPNRRAALGFVLLALPLLVSLGVFFSPFNWIWYRTEYADVAGGAMAILSWAIMACGQRLLNPTLDAKRLRTKHLVLAGLIGVAQLFSFAIDVFSTVIHRQSFADGRQAYTVGQGAFGGTWDATWVSQPLWLLLRREYRVEQYDKGSVDGLKVTADGGLDVLKSEFGRENFVTHYSPGQLEAIRRKHWHIEP